MFPNELTKNGIAIEDFYGPGIDEKYAKDRRIDYLECECIEIRALMGAHKRLYQEEFENDGCYNDRYLIFYAIHNLQDLLRKHESEIYFLKAGGDRQELQVKLSRAKQRQFEDFIELNGNKALCPFHDDHHPSFSIRNNRGRCFACGWHGDIVDFVQQKFKLSFVEAINKLC